MEWGKLRFGGVRFALLVVSGGVVYTAAVWCMDLWNTCTWYLILIAVSVRIRVCVAISTFAREQMVAFTRVDVCHRCLERRCNYMRERVNVAAREEEAAFVLPTGCDTSAVDAASSIEQDSGVKFC